MAGKRGTIIKLVTAYWIMLVLFVAGCCLARLIPDRLVEKNFRESMEIMGAEGKYVETLDLNSGHLDYFYTLDNYTDVLMMNIVMGVDGMDAWDAAMLDPYYADNVEAVFCDNGHGEQECLQERDILYYGRYWQGYTLPLKLLLIAGDINFIRVFNYVALLLLLGWCLWLIYTRLSGKVALVFGLYMVLLGIPVLPMCMQLSTNFYITFITIVVSLSNRRWSGSRANLCTLFFVVGGLTAYLDFLTAPLVTIGFPLAVALYGRRGTCLVTALSVILCWGLGYALLWASKWILVAGFTDFDMLADAGANIAYRLGRTVDVAAGTTTYEGAISALYGVTAVAVGVLSGMALYHKRRYGSAPERTYLLLVAIVPVLWFVAAYNHTVVHFFYTWRSVGCSLFCLTLYLLSMIAGSPRRSVANEECEADRRR